MTQYLIRRLLLIPPTFLGVTLLVFAITRFVPGGPVERMIAEMQAQSNNTGGEATMAQLDEEQLAMLNEYYGFDKPILVSYWEWLLKVLTGDLGASSRYGDPVVDIIKEEDADFGVLWGLQYDPNLYCLHSLGIVEAIKHKSILDNVSSVLVFVGYALPAYVVGIILLVYSLPHLEWFPLGGFYSDDFEDYNTWEQILDIGFHAVLPLTAYVMGSFAVTTFMLKNALMDNLAADFVRTAMAKGMSFETDGFQHTFQNSLIPIATHFGNNISVIIAGSFLIEKIFNIDGFGLLGYESIIRERLSSGSRHSCYCRPTTAGWQYPLRYLCCDSRSTGAV